MSFAKVSPTAKLVAYMRQFSDIPFAKDVAQHLRAKEAVEALLRDERAAPEDLLLYAPILEARYKSIVEMIRRSGATQVLELASGFSLRGLAMTRDPGITYVESDLEDLTREKAALIADLRSRYGLASHGNFHLAVADATDRGQVLAAAQALRRDSAIAVITEGLLLYLSTSELVTVARNIRELLTQFGGVWITSDLLLKEELRKAPEPQQRFRRIVASATERKLYDSAFDDDAGLHAFFGRLELNAQAVNQVDLAPDIVSLDATGLPRRLLEEARPGMRLWIMKTAGPRSA